MRQRFRGEITGFGTSSGRRVVIGHWTTSPFGGFADVMTEAPDGVRTLLAPSDEVAAFVSTTYEFDRVEIVEVEVARTAGALSCRAGPFLAEVDLGARTALGHLLRLVPRRVAESPTWCSLVDPFAALVLRGVRTRGSAGNGRREWYGATDQRSVDAVRASWSGVGLGPVADVWPPVGFGFSSTPRRPSNVEVVTTIEHRSPSARAARSVRPWTDR